MTTSYRARIRQEAARSLQRAAALGLAAATPIAVTGAADNGAGRIRLAVAATAGLTGPVIVAGVAGTVEANSASNVTPSNPDGGWYFVVVDATHIDLGGSEFVNDYVSGGTVVPDYAIFAPLVGSLITLNRTWPTLSLKAAPSPNQLLLYTFHESSQPLGKNGQVPAFNTTLTLVVEARIEMAIKETTMDDSLGEALDVLCEAVREALLTDPCFVALFSSIGKSETGMKPQGEGQRQVNNAIIGLDVVFQDRFPPRVTEIFQGAAIYVDAASVVVDPSGTYVPPFAYAPTPAPRTAGPDGRVEAGGDAGIDTLV